MDQEQKFQPGNKSKTMVQVTRRSKRQPKPVRVPSLEGQESDAAKDRKRPRKNPPNRIPTRRVIGPIDSEGKPFCCDKCKSPYVIDPKKSSKVESKKIPAPRYKIDPETGRRLKLCNACGLAFDRALRKHQRPKPAPPTEDDKKKYADDAEKFANSLVEGLRDPDAAKLACPHFGQKPCGCIQRFVIGEGDMEDSRQKASQLLLVLKEAKKLKVKKCYNVDEVISRGKKHRKVGLGNGQKKSKEFEQFVLTKRKYLRDDLKLCERATQRILLYSNNFLHKRLKTEPERTQRIERSRGQAALGLLKAIAELPEEKCCDDCCVLLAKTHSVLLTQWRERANSGQADARKVLAEMLTPSGLRSNCYKFINLVTGCSLSTITRVSDQMKATGGDREPPPHGLCKYWEDNPRRPRKMSTSNDIPTYRAPPRPVSIISTVGSTNNTTPVLTQAQLKEQQLQLKRLQQQLEEQQRQVSQQQSAIEQQLLQHKVASQQKKQIQQQQQMRLREQETQRLQQQALQQEQQQQQQIEQQQLEQQQQQQLEQQQQQDAQEQSIAQPTNQLQAVAQSVPSSFAMTTGQTNPTSTSLTPNLDGLNPQLLQQNMQHLLTEIASQITQQQQNMQQLLAEMQNELTAQQIQQLSSAGNGNPTIAANLNSAITSQPPPSYPVAMALNAVNASQAQQVQTTSSTGGTGSVVTSNNNGQYGPHVIIQAIPTLQQNVLLGNTTLTSQLLSNGSATDMQEQTHHETSTAGAVQLHNQSYPQQILVSLPQSLNQDTLTASTLAQNTLTQDVLNATEIVEIQLQEVPPNQEITQDRTNQDLNGHRQVTNELQEAIAQQIRLGGLNFGNQEFRATLGSLPAINQLQTSTRNRSSRSPHVDSNADLTGDSTRQAISLLQQANDVSTTGSTAVVGSQLSVETLLSPEALQMFGSAVNQSLVLQPIMSSVSKQNTAPTSQ